MSGIGLLLFNEHVLFFADYQTLVKPGPNNTPHNHLSAFSQSTDDPYSVVIVESKLQNDVDKSTKGELHLNTSLDDILDICDQKSRQVSSPDKLHTLTLAHCEKKTCMIRSNLNEMKAQI